MRIKLKGPTADYLAQDGGRDLLADELHVINRRFENRGRVILSPLDVGQQGAQLLTAVLDPFSERRIIIRSSWSVFFLAHEDKQSFLLGLTIKELPLPSRPPFQRKAEALESQLPGNHAAAKGLADGGPAHRPGKCAGYPDPEQPRSQGETQTLFTEVLL